MLTQTRVERAIQEGGIAVRYSFVADEKQGLVNIGEQPVDPGQPDLPATRMFRKNFFGDRLRLTLGPVIMTHNREYRGTRPAFKGRRGYANLLDSDNTLILEPHESVSVSTNERITLNEDYAAFILPRLTNVDSGLVYVPSYIDPCWDGILQGVIINTTRERQSLCIAEPIAICRFYPVQGEVGSHTREVFPAKSHHYGSNWPKILTQDVDPFPRRKHPLPPNRWRLFWGRVWEWFELYRRWLVGLGFTGGVLVLVFTLGGTYVDVRKIPRLEEQVQDLRAELSTLGKHTVPDMATEVESISQRLPESGVTAVQLQEGKTSGTFSFDVERQFKHTNTAWAEPLTDVSAVASVTARAQPSSRGPQATTLVLTVRLKEPGPEREVQVKWMVLD